LQKRCTDVPQAQQKDAPSSQHHCGFLDTVKGDAEGGNDSLSCVQDHVETVIPELEARVAKRGDESVQESIENTAQKELAKQLSIPDYVSVCAHTIPAELSPLKA
jgi:hypothetical protein